MADKRVERRFTWRKGDVVFARDPTRPPLLTPEQRAIARANLKKYREEEEGKPAAEVRTDDRVTRIGRVVIHHD